MKQRFGSIILELTPTVHKYFMDKNKIKIGWKNYKFYNYINIIRCYNCYRFNHLANK